MDAARSRKHAAIQMERPRLEEISTPGSQEDDYARAELAGDVRAAVSALPPKFRIAILLRYFEELSYEQMSKALHCSMGTVASRLSRGHKLLAELLKSKDNVKEIKRTGD